MIKLMLEKFTPVTPISGIMKNNFIKHKFSEIGIFLQIKGFHLKGIDHFFITWSIRGLVF